MAKATATPYYSSSTRLPQRSAAALTDWWMPEGLETRKYRLYKVEVLSKSASKLQIHLAGDKWLMHPRRKQDVDLDLNKYVYAGLPSTALLVEPGQEERFAFLLLSDDFIHDKTLLDKKEIPTYADVDEKWPFGAEGRRAARRKTPKTARKKTAKRAKKA